MDLIQTKSFKLAVYSKGDKNAPKFALVLPGKLDSKDYPHMHSHVNFLAKKGFFALTFDPPGTWESPGDIKLYTMTNYLKAVDELIEYYGNKPTFIMGHSRGATVSIIAGARNRNIFAFAAVMSTFAKGSLQEEDDENWKKTGLHISKRDLPPGGGEKVKEFRLPYGFFEDQTHYDLDEDLTSSTKPKIFILGKNDDLATPDTVRQTFSLFAKPKELHELDSGHDYRLSKAKIEDVNKILENFLNKYDK